MHEPAQAWAWWLTLKCKMRHKMYSHTAQWRAPSPWKCSSQWSPIEHLSIYCLDQSTNSTYLLTYCNAKHLYCKDLPRCLSVCMEICTHAFHDVQSGCVLLLGNRWSSCRRADEVTWDAQVSWFCCEGAPKSSKWSECTGGKWEYSGILRNTMTLDICMTTVVRTVEMQKRTKDFQSKTKSLWGFGRRLLTAPKRSLNRNCVTGRLEGDEGGS